MSIILYSRESVKISIFKVFETSQNKQAIYSTVMRIKAPTPKTLPIVDAWKPLPITHWREEEAAHLLRRIGFSADPGTIKKIIKQPILNALDSRFGQKNPLNASTAFTEFSKELPNVYFELYNNKDLDPVVKQERQQKKNRDNNKFYRELTMNWYGHARAEENSAQEKFVLFLHDIFVIDQRKVQDAPNLYSFQNALREGVFLNYPQLCKNISREPGMIVYLDLAQNTAKKPNENFARELFELFILGEGHYTENDIKEAARAFTGYRLRKKTEFVYHKRFHDSGQKTVFGKSGNWGGDAVIDIAFEQPAARTFFIRELLKFYLTDGVLPHDDYIIALGDLWADNNFEIRYLIDTVFQSRLFFHPAYRGNMVKSPIHFYMGLCQDLNLDIIPLQGPLIRQMLAMGQNLYNPPNVRGWLYGEKWINSTTVSARRQIVNYLFSSVNEERLNGNQKKSLADARAANKGNFLISNERLRPMLKNNGEALTQQLCRFFITELSQQAYVENLGRLIGDPKSQGALYRARNAIIALLQSPAYNLC